MCFIGFAKGEAAADIANNHDHRGALPSAIPQLLSIAQRPTALKPLVGGAYLASSRKSQLSGYNHRFVGGVAKGHGHGEFSAFNKRCDRQWM
jgi:hypothetical protein